MSTRSNTPRPVTITKQMLGNRTRKNILYLDQTFLSSVHRGGEENEWATALMSQITQLLDLQLLAIPYSSTHIGEADLNGEFRDALVMFIQRVSRGHHFEPSYRVKEMQILKAFQRLLNGAPAAFDRDERDALCLSVHDRDSDYSVSVFSGARDQDRKAALKQEALSELIQTLPQWAKKGRTFEEDMSLEISDEARLLIDSFVDKSTRLRVGDFLRLDRRTDRRLNRRRAVDACPIEEDRSRGYRRISSIRTLCSGSGCATASSIVQRIHRAPSFCKDTTRSDIQANPEQTLRIFLRHSARCNLRSMLQGSPLAGSRWRGRRSQTAARKWVSPPLLRSVDRSDR